MAREPPKQSRPPHACAVPTVNMGLMVDRLPWRADVKVAEGPRWRWWAQSNSWGRPGLRSCAQLGQGRPWPRGPRTALLGLACLLGQARPCGFVERVPQLAISESSTSIASWVRTLTVADSLRESLGSCVLDFTAVRDERLDGRAWPPPRSPMKSRYSRGAALAGGVAHVRERVPDACSPRPRAWTSLACSGTAARAEHKATRGPKRLRVRP